MTSDIRAKRRPSEWRRVPGISAAQAGERDLVVSFVVQTVGIVSRAHTAAGLSKGLVAFPFARPYSYEGIHRLWLERPSCSRRQMTVWLRVWVIQTLMRGVNSVQGQNPFGLCQDVRLSGLYYRPDPPVLPTGSALGISTPLLKGSSTSATPVAPGEGE